MLKVAVRDPVAAGVKVTAIVQELPAASEDPQVFASEKSSGSVPAKVVPEIVKLAVPVLLRVTV
jgi:hypothetical protein